MSVVVLARASLIPLDNFLGAWLIGLIISSVLFGVTCLQVYLYFTKHCSHDTVFLKAFVAILLALDTLHLSFVSHSFYSTTVTNFGDYVELGKAPWSLLIQILVAVLLSTQVQLFYAYRIYTLSNKSLLFPVTIGVCAFGEFALGIVYMRKTFQIKFFKLAQADIPYSTSALAFEVACDVLIAGAMIYHLLRNKTGFHKTDTAINLLVTYSLSSGAIATLFAICSLVTWITSPTTLIYALFYFVLVRVYGLSFMSLLNSREHVREQMFSGDVVSTFPSYPPVDTTLHMSDMSASVYDGKQEAV